VAKSKTLLLVTIRRELIKEHCTFDGSNRPLKKYIAPVSATQGSPCLVIEYLYYGITSVVKGRSEGYDVWQSSFDELDYLVDDLGNNLTDDLGNLLLGA